MLLEEFLLSMEISQNALARATGVPPRRINEIVLGKRGITADTALRLAKAFGTSEGFWLGLQADYDLEKSRKQIGKTWIRLNGWRLRFVKISTTAHLIVLGAWWWGMWHQKRSWAAPSAPCMKAAQSNSRHHRCDQAAASVECG